MIKETKFFTGGLNADDAYQVFTESDLVNVFNATFANNRDGKQARIEFIPGTREVAFAYPSGGGFIIGSAIDVPRKRIFYLRYSYTGNHGIYCLDDSGIKNVIDDVNVTGGLGFDGSKLINGARVVGDLLYWNQPDTINGQRRINVEAALKASNPSYSTSVTPYTLPIANTVITLYRKQPSYAPIVTKVTQSSPAIANNYIEKESFQFAMKYTYRDGEESKLSPYSKLAPHNKYFETFNCIDVTVPTSEAIEQDVQSVEVCVRYGNTGGFFIVKRWDKNSPTDAALIANHQTTPLKYRFYNDQIGEALGEAYYTAQFDSLPIKSETLELIKNRIHLGNNVEGYTTPVKTSMVCDVQVIGGAVGGTVTNATWWKLEYVRYVFGLPVIADVFLLQILGIPGAGWYTTFVLTETEPLPTSIGFASLEFVGESYPIVYEWAYMNLPTSEIYSWGPTIYTTVTVTDVPTSTALEGTRAHKSGATKRAGLVFADEFGRKCGVVPGTSVEIPDRDYGLNDYVQNVAWSLSNADAVNEIPDWAYYYIPVITRCLTTTFFIQRRAVGMTYVTKDTSGAYEFTASTYATTNVGIGVDISDLPNIGYGYSYQEGDIVKLYRLDDSPPVSLSVVGVEGRWLICELADMGSLVSGTSMLYEIYTPYVGSLNEFYYEIGDVFKVSLPGTGARTYSATAGVFEGDVYLVKREKAGDEYLVEAMSNNDKVWKEWFSDYGRPNIIDRIGQKIKRSNISFSNQRIPETGINGLSSFDPLDETNEIPAESGPIRKLIAASRTVSDGSVMLCICEADTFSIYIGETQVRDNAGQQLLSTTEGVIGTINPLRGGFGTVNQESVQSWNGNVFWWDLNRATIVMYGGGGLERISEFKMATVFKKFADDYRDWLAGNGTRVPYDGANGYVFGYVNPADGSYYVTLPRLFWDSPSNELYDTIIEEL
jgi:hypothetical protein